MNPFYAGLMCTSLLVGTIASLFGCMSAVRCHHRSAFAICLVIALLDFAPLAVLLARLPESETLSPVPWTAAALSLTALSLFASFTLWHKSRRQLSPVSIKESCDHLPSALCFAGENGLPCLKNLKMDELSHLLTGGALLNANVFWETIESQPIVTLENGQTWSFERVRMEMNGKIVYQITGEKTESGWRIRYLNDGDVPSGPIVEGSGLTALRARTEAAGGAMEVFHAPRFELALTLPGERQEIP